MPEEKISQKVSIGEIFYTFLIIGTVTVGGGPGGIPIIQGYVVDKKQWITQEEMLNYITISQSMPGTISAHIAAFVGHQLRGKKGAITATIAGILPSFLSIIGIAIFLRPLLENQIIQNAFKGIRIGVLGLIINAAYRMGMVMNWKKVYILLTLVSLVIFVFTNTNPAILFVIGAVIGLFNYKIQTARVDEGAENGAH